jgi:DNA-directed RNA polymerase sigma subunit (sigma70/sigma32)
MNTKNNNDRLIINHKYYQDLSKFDNLSQNEIKDLYSLIITGNTKATNTLIESNLKLWCTLQNNIRTISIKMKHLILMI